VHETDCDDLVQELFVRLCRQDALAGVHRADAYLFEMAANLAYDYHRRSSVRRSNPVDDHYEAVHRTGDFSPDRIAEGREELALIARALAELPERTRNVFVLARLENMPRAEIATRLGIAKRTVEKLITTATAHIALSRGRYL
jgi:RNA polymerase sigma-70 factor (ECF subfamily)